MSFIKRIFSKIANFFGSLFHFTKNDVNDDDNGDYKVKMKMGPTSVVINAVSTQTNVDDTASIYDDLAKEKLLKQPSFLDRWLGQYLVMEGQLGLCLNEGKPEFLAPGRHAIWSPFRDWKSTVKITEKKIELGSVQIITVNDREVLVAEKNGAQSILETGRHILRAPHFAVRFEEAHITKEITLKNFTVNIKDKVSITIDVPIEYRIINPDKAVLNFKNVHSVIENRAKATLTRVFASLPTMAISSILFSYEEFLDSATKRFKEKFEPVISSLGGLLLSIELSEVRFSAPIKKAFDDRLANDVKEKARRLRSLSSSLDLANRHTPRLFSQPQNNSNNTQSAHNSNDLLNASTSSFTSVNP